MHNVNVDTLNQTIAKATDDPGAAKKTIGFDGEWRTACGARWRATR